uniref:ARID domain-containing protein n=1 Tax=Anopheles culicifacies TaxID=139723 RepID=A0A182MT77_9DIPT
MTQHYELSATYFVIAILNVILWDAIIAVGSISFTCTNRDSTGQNSNDSTTGGSGGPGNSTGPTGVHGAPGTPNSSSSSSSQGMRPTPSPTGSGSGSRSMSPAVGQQSVSMPPRPSSSHSQTPNQQQQGPNHQHGNSNSNLVHGNQTQGPPDHHARVASPNRPPSASAQQQQLPPVSTAQSGSASLPPSSQAGGGGSAGAAAGMAAQGYQAQAPHPPHMHGPYKMGPGGPGGMPPGGPGQQMSPYPPPPPHQQPPPQSQQYSPHSPASYSPRPQYPGAYGPSPPVPGPPPPGTQSPQQGPPGSGGPPPPHPPPGGYPGQHRMPNHVGAGGPPPPHSQYPPHQYPHQPPSPWGPPHTQAGPGGAGAGHVNNHVQQSQQGQSGPPTPGGPGGPRQGKGMPPGPPGAGGVHPQSPQQQQHSQHHQPPPHHQPHHQAHHQPPHHPGQAQSQQPPPQSGSPQPLNYLKQHLQHKGAYSGAPSPTPPPGQGYGNGPGMHPPMGPPHHMGPPMGLPPPPNASSMGPPPPAGTPPSQSPSGAGSSAVGHQHPSQQDSGHPPSPHQQQPPTQPQHPGQQSQQPQQQPPHSPHHHPHGPPPHAQHQPGHHPGADVPPQPHHGLLAGAGQDNGIVNATGGPGGGAVGGPHHHHHPHHHHPVTSLVTTGPDGAPLDEASQQTSGEDPTCSTPKSRKNDHYNQSHLTGTNTPSSSNASPGPHNAHEDFELNSSPTSTFTGAEFGTNSRSSHPSTGSRSLRDHPLVVTSVGGVAAAGAVTSSSPLPLARREGLSPSASSTTCAGSSPSSAAAATAAAAAALVAYWYSYSSYTSPSRSHVLVPSKPATPMLTRRPSNVASRSRNVDVQSQKSDSLNKLYEMDDKPERRVFLDKLLAYMDERRSPITACPTISKTPLDLYKLYVYVQERGGFVEVCKVTKSKTWKDIAGMLGIGASSSAAYTLRKHYTKNLLPFECKFDRGGIDPGPIIAQVEAGSKKKSAKTTSVPSPGSSNSQDSFPAPGSSSASMDGYGPYPGSGYPPGSTPDYVQQQQQQGSAGGPPGVATPGAQPGPGQQQTPQPQQRPPSQQSGTQSPHPGSAPPTSGDNISVSNPFDDPVGPQRPPYQQGAPYPPVSRPQGAPYQGQPGGYGQYGAPEQYGPSTGTPPGQYPPPPGQQGQYPPTNRPLYPPYAPPESGEGGTPPSSAAGVPGPPSGADPYRGYGSSPYPPPPQQRPYPPQQQPVVSAAPGVPPAGTPPIPGQAGGASQGQVPPGGPPTQQQQQPQQTPPPQQQPGAQGQPGAPGGYPAPVGQPGVPQSAADYYRQQQEQPNQPRRHPDFEKSQQPYPPYQQRPQMYPGGWQAGPGGQYRGQYPPQSPQQQWAHNGPRPSGPPGPPGAGGPPGGPPGAPGQWGAAADVNRYPPNQQQPPYPTHQQGQQQPWNQMPPTSQNSPLRPPLRSGKPYPPMAGAGPGVPTPPGSMPGMPPSSINTPPQPPGVVGGPPGATTSSGPVVPVTGGVPPVVPSAGGVVPGSGVPSVAGNATGVVPGVAPVPNASPAVKAQPSVQSGGQVQPAGPNFQPPGTGGVQQKRDIVFPTDSVEATTPVLYRRKRITKLDIGQTDAWRIFMALRSGLLVESTWALDVLNILLFDDSSVAYFGLAHMPGLLNLLLDHFQKSLCDMFESGKREGTTNRFSVEATNRAALLDKMLDVADDDEPEKEEQGHTMHSQSSIVNASSIAVTTTTTETTIKLEPASPMMMATTTMTTTTTTTMIKQEKLENGLPDAAPLHHNGTQENGGRAATKCTGSAIDRRRTAQCYARRSTKPCDSNEELDLGSVKNPPNPDERTLILTSTTNYTMTSRKGRPVKIHPAEDDVFVLDHRRDWDRASDYQYQRDTEVGGDPWTAGHTDPDPHDYIMDTFRAEFVNIPFAKYIKTSAKYAEAAKAASGNRNGKRIAATINNNNCYISGISNNNNSAKCTSKNEREQQQEQTVHEAPAPAEKNTTTALKNTSEEVTEMDVEEDGEELLSPPKRRKEESSATVTAPTLRTRKDHHIARLMNGESGEDEEAKEKAGDGGVEKVVKNCIVKKEKATVDDKEAAAPETVDSKATAKGTTPTPMDADCREIDMELEKTSSLSNGPQEPAHTADTERENSNETSVTADREQHHQQNSVKSEDCQKSPAVVKPADEKMDIDESEENAALSAAVTVPAVRKTIAFDIAETVRDPARVLKRRRMSDYEDECYTRDEASLYLVTEGQDALARRCVAISNILRNLTFLPNNETEFSKSSRFLAILGKLLLLNHEHPLRTKKTRNYDREEDADFSDSCSSLQGEHEWWWDFLVQIRENMLVATANISGQLDLSRFDEPISRPILDGLLHWAVCPSAHGQDPFPTLGPNAALSPQRLALEALCKLCVTDANVDLVIATPPFSRLEKLCSVLTRHLCKNEDQVLREFSVNLLHYLAAADSSMARTVALQSPCVSYLVAFIEQAEQSALGVANQHGINFLRDNPDSMGTSLDMLRRAAGTLLHLAKHPDNRPLFMQQEQRLLGLVMSHILDQQVALIISRVLYQCSRGTGPLTTMEIESGGKPNSNASSSVTTASNTSSSAMEAKAGADSKTAMSANGSSSSLAAATPADGSSPSSATNGSGATTVTNSGTVSQQATANGQLAAEEFVTPSTPSTAANVSEGAESNRSGNVETSSSIAGSTAVVAAYDESSSSSSSNATADHHEAYTKYGLTDDGERQSTKTG